MVERLKLQLAIAHAILPFALETASEYNSTDSDDPLNDPFVTETATFLTQEIIDSGLDIADDDAELDDEEVENLPLAHVLTPLLQELFSPKDPTAIISTIIQIYTSPEPDPDVHHRIRYGSCEVFSSEMRLT
jgi:hypothetical protein